MHYRVAHGTIVIFLQNDAGFKIWGPNEKKVRALLDAFQIESEDSLLNNSHRSTSNRRDSKVRKIDPEKTEDGGTGDSTIDKPSSSGLPRSGEGDFKTADGKPD